MEPVMRLIDIGKAYGDHQIISALSWDVHAGQVVALVGPNGAGKSTLLRVMAGYDQVTQGVLEYQGRDVTQFRLHLRQEVGYLSDRPFLYPHLTAAEFLGFVCQLRKISLARASRLLDQFSIPSGVLISDLSYGTARKVAIASATLHGPRLVLLDEPFNALDMLANKALQDLITTLKSQGCAVVVATHYLPALEPVYDQVLLLNPSCGAVALEAQPSTSLENLLAKYLAVEGNQC